MSTPAEDLLRAILENPTPERFRLVAVGRKKAAHPTITVQYATGDALWTPQASPGEPEIDHDLIRKMAIESREDRF
jgi:hypothetical protein